MNNAAALDVTERNRRATVAHLIAQGQYKDAEPHLLSMLQIAPNNAWAYGVLGIVYRFTNRETASDAAFKRSLHLEPDNAEILSHYGGLLLDMYRIDESLYYTRRAVELDPENYQLRKTLGQLERDAKLFDDSVKSYEWCRERTPDDPNLIFDYGYVLLYTRDLQKGWDYFETRFQTDRMDFPNTSHLKLWEGESLKGKTVLVIGEQGFGDTLLMTRFLPLLEAKGAKITFGCSDVFNRAFVSLGYPIVNKIGPLDNYDFFIPMMTLPRHFERDWLKWPKPIKLDVPQPCRQKFSWLANHGEKRLRVGIVWSGRIAYAGNKRRAVDLSRFLELSALYPDIEFYSFQKGEREPDLMSVGKGPITPLGHLFADFADTTAALEHMDCILMTDSSLVHLASGQGVPVIDLLGYRPYWLYFPEAPTTPLYPSLRFIRQKQAGDWDDVFKRAKVILDALRTEKRDQPLTADRVLKIIDANLQS